MHPYRANGASARPDSVLLMTDETINAYMAALQSELATGAATEHTYRPAFKALIESSGQGLHAINEPRREACGAPDFVIAIDTPHGPLTIGHVETKDIGVSLAATARTNQLRRYRSALPNLLLTDYLDFRWYVDGELQRAATLGDADHLAISASDGSGTDVVALLADFLGHEPASVSEPRELSERLARLTHLVRDVVVQSFEQDVASETVRGLKQAFVEVLVPDLGNETFADMLAQTMSYGLFAARVNHADTSPFSRQSAARDIPRANPFLRRLFGAITGPDLDEEPFAALVDDVAQLLAHTDIPAVLAAFGRRAPSRDPLIHFYESFLAAYDPRLRESRGVYYTPEPVVSFIVRSVDELLRDRFALPEGLASTQTTHCTRLTSTGRQRFSNCRGSLCSILPAGLGRFSMGSSISSAVVSSRTSMPVGGRATSRATAPEVVRIRAHHGSVRDIASEARAPDASQRFARGGSRRLGGGVR